MKTTVLFRNKSGRRGTSRRFFTLMELVAATGIMLSVAGIIGFASHTFYKSVASAQKVTTRLKKLVNVDQLMDGCFRNMIPFNWVYEDEYDDTYQVFMGEEDFIHFTTLRRSYDQDTGCLFFVRVYLEDNGDLIAEYSKFPRLPWMEDVEEMPYESEVITSDVDSILFLYAGVDLDGETVVWREYWSREDYDFIPHAVQLTIKWKDGSEECWLRRTAASGSNSAYGGLQMIDE